jgi:hypothetical protein
VFFVLFVVKHDIERKARRFAASWRGHALFPGGLWRRLVYHGHVLMSTRVPLLRVVAISLSLAGCGGNSDVAPSVETGGGLEAVLPEGARRFLRIVSRSDNLIPAVCGGILPAQTTFLFGASTITRTGTRVSGSNVEFITASGGPGIPALIEGDVSGATLRLDIRMDYPPAAAYREQWTATLRAEGRRGVAEGRSNGTSQFGETPAVCLATWTDRAFVAEIVESG